ncbi:MAG TPA: biotin attachment protein [Algoriphagus sp.]|jgi:multidrug resistance efflux pump|uniref:HlyD family secretion protein n=1 Tax=unclassified Algoriphagus TaxID=2641541 RepID=UPI000C4F179F|nr:MULTISPECIES: HlyD family efflux transporter periplasmic adaptor subunit [unclassified Algoriphagus]MAL16040.1 biotin attachment protein [Algoriphagus sp.]HAD50564.1 biotin attachment protein [Algoriphagus sp.]HCD87347.1 biotin attachment protein [Algoriphagus sp.]HCH44381.1 biotin attachment protein [Algoriphagus sp.]|tara:strand:+ start:2919 stop:4274 length:1356 start_codon:yes stop_codon:yes gene_type:complete
MLNISNIRIKESIPFSGAKSLVMTLPVKESQKRVRILTVIMLVFFGMLFLPWTQNIRSKGYVTALRPDQRPQTIHSVIAGRIEKWYVSEGAFVSKGDTILRISEIKDEYFDSLLLPRTQQQVNAKTFAARSYGEKVEALKAQIQALERNNILKIQQAENKLRMAELKVESDSIKFYQASVNFDIGKQQLARYETLYLEGLQSLTELESRRLRFQDVNAKLIAAENDYLSSQNELLSAQIELGAIDNEFKDKLAKARSEMYTAMSSQFDTEATVSKLENTYSNYEARTGFRYILAPQDGYLARAIQVGLGETIKEGDPILNIVPAEAALAVEMYVQPVDLPLIKVGNKVRFIFDGWPAIVFSGWPQISNGTFGGVVVAIDQFAGNNNQYRVLVIEDPEEEAWPEMLRIGSGADGIALLNDVPVWYEIWRQLNGFPADYYTQEQKDALAKEKK